MNMHGKNHRPRRKRRRRPDVRRVLRRLKVSTYELSKRLQMDKSQATALVVGRVVPNWDTLTRIADALGVSVGDFDGRRRKGVARG
jgi:transcriptional regulator with XRE-family HTH domain